MRHAPQMVWQVPLSTPDMATTDLPTPTIIEVDKTEFTPVKTPTKVRTPLQERLQSSPRKVLSPEIIRTRQEQAQQRRLMFEEEKVNKAHAVVEHVKEVRERAKNLPKEDCADA